MKVIIMQKTLEFILSNGRVDIYDKYNAMKGDISKTDSGNTYIKYVV